MKKKSAMDKERQLYQMGIPMRACMMKGNDMDLEFTGESHKGTAWSNGRAFARQNVSSLDLGPDSGLYDILESTQL